MSQHDAGSPPRAPHDGESPDPSADAIVEPPSNSGATESPPAEPVRASADEQSPADAADAGDSSNVDGPDAASVEASEPGEPELPPSLPFRIMRTLLLLASSIVIVAAVPILAWQSTTLAKETFDVADRTITARIVKRFGVVQLRLRDEAANSERRHALRDPTGRRLTGPVSLQIDDDGRRIRIRMGDYETTFEFTDGEFAETAGDSSS